MIDIAPLHRRLEALPDDRRSLVALAGPPGAGKSTVASIVASELNAQRPGVAAVVGMDGFHYDDMVLDALGLRSRKGAPDTFDLDGLEVLLGRLRCDDGKTIAVPVFDRTIETARAGAQLLPSSVRFVLVEGNYLLLDQPGWAELRRFFDLTVLIETDILVLRDRLMQRWLDLGLSPVAAAAKVEENDLPNARLVAATSSRPDLVLL